MWRYGKSLNAAIINMITFELTLHHILYVQAGGVIFLLTI